jgi:hypothetical protein
MVTRIHRVTIHLSDSLESFPGRIEYSDTLQILKDDRAPSPSASSGSRCLEKKLLDHPHVGPVILELVSAVQTDNVMFASRSGDVPV